MGEHRPQHQGDKPGHEGHNKCADHNGPHVALNGVFFLNVHKSHSLLFHVLHPLQVMSGVQAGQVLSGFHQLLTQGVGGGQVLLLALQVNQVAPQAVGQGEGALLHSSDFLHRDIQLAQELDLF